MFNNESADNDNNDSFPVVLSHMELPSSLKSFKELGLPPIGCNITPFSFQKDIDDKRKDSSDQCHASNIARCEACLAYINPLCSLTHTKWHCSLCGTKNVYNRHRVIIFIHSHCEFSLINTINRENTRTMKLNACLRQIALSTTFLATLGIIYIHILLLRDLCRDTLH